MALTPNLSDLKGTHPGHYFHFRLKRFEVDNNGNRMHEHETEPGEVTITLSKDHNSINPLGRPHFVRYKFDKPTTPTEVYIYPLEDHENYHSSYHFHFVKLVHVNELRSENLHIAVEKTYRGERCRDPNCAGDQSNGQAITRTEVSTAESIIIKRQGGDIDENRLTEYVVDRNTKELRAQDSETRRVLSELAHGARDLLYEAEDVVDDAKHIIGAVKDTLKDAKDLLKDAKASIHRQRSPMGRN